MDLSPEYVAVARELEARLVARSRYHVWQDAEYYWCPSERAHGVYVAEGEMHDHVHADDVWLPRGDQLLDIAEMFGIIYVGLLSATSGCSAVGSTGRVVGSEVEQYGSQAPTREQALARLVIAAL